MKFRKLFITVLFGTLILSACNRKGCTDSTATNYEASAKKDDGSCVYPAPPKNNDPNPTPNSKDSSNTPNDTTIITETVASLSSFFDLRKVGSETFTFDATTGGTFNASKGSKINIPSNALVFKDGSSVSGSVNLKVKEVFSESDMIFSGVFPISNSYVLNSGGEFFIQASQGGKELIVKNGSMINMEIPAQAVDKNMELFLAGPGEDSDTVNWVPADSSFTGSGFSFQSADNSYSINLDSLGWGNIDAFIRNIQYFDCKFTLTGVSGLDNNNTTAFAVFKNQNAVWPVGKGNWGNIIDGVINESHLANVPLNLVVISVVDKKLYSGLLDTTPQDGKTYSIPMTRTSSEKLDQLISNLP